MAHKKSLPKLKKELWKVFSLYVRERDHWTCYTCGAIAFGPGMHGGHFIPKASGGLALYFHPDNVHAQCARCNLFLEGNHYEYGIRLGKRKVARLYALRGVITKWSEQDYLKKIAHYKKAYTKLIVKKNEDRKPKDI